MNETQEPLTNAAENRAIGFLRKCYRENDSYRRILDSFANKSQARSQSFVRRITRETQVPERDVRSFLKEVLQKSGLGKFKKGVHGYKSRFEWNVTSNVSLVNVGLAAKNEEINTLRAGNNEVFVSEDDIDQLDDGIIELNYSLPRGNGRRFKIEFPADLSKTELQLFHAWLEEAMASRISGD